MNRQPQLALIGCGDWGENLARSFSAQGALRSLCDSDPQRLRALHQRHPDTRACGSLAEILTDPLVDAVVLATPASCHYEQAKQALRAQRDVFVEKPLALRYHQGAELVALAQAQEKMLFVGHILEYHPAIEAIEAIKPELGALWYIYSNRLNLGKVRQEENILWSFAPHDISLICRLFEESPQEVSATGASYLQPGIVDVTMSTLRFSEARRAHLFVSWLHPFKEQRLMVIGEKKALSFDGGALTLYHRGIAWSDGKPVPQQQSAEQLAFSSREPLQIECERFLDCLRSRVQPLTSGERALRVLRVLEASQRSLEQGGATVRLSEI